MDITFNAIYQKYGLNFNDQLFSNYYHVIKGLFIDDNHMDINTSCDNIDPILCYIYGVYYYVTKNYDKMKKCYSIAIKFNNDMAMNNLANYYESIENNYDYATQLYLMAIALGNSFAMNNLALYYYGIEKKYDLAKEYLHMAVKLDNSAAMNNLACYYENIEKDFYLAKQHYLMAISCNNKSAMFNLATYYMNIENNIDLSKKYYLMAHNGGLIFELKLNDSIEHNINIIDIALTIKHSKTAELIRLFMLSYENIPDDLIHKYNRILKIIVEEYYLLIYRKLIIPYKLNNVNGDTQFTLCFMIVVSH